MKFNNSYPNLSSLWCSDFGLYKNSEIYTSPVRVDFNPGDSRSIPEYLNPQKKKLRTSFLEQVSLDNLGKGRVKKFPFSQKASQRYLFKYEWLIGLCIICKKYEYKT